MGDHSKDFFSSPAGYYMAAIVGLAFGGGLTWGAGFSKGIAGLVGAYLCGGGALGFLFVQLHSILHFLHTNNQLLIQLCQNSRSGAYHVALGDPPQTSSRVNGTDA